MDEEQKNILDKKSGKKFYVTKNDNGDKKNSPIEIIGTEEGEVKDPKKVEEEITKVLGYALEYINRKNFKEAENIYRKVLLSYKNHPDALFRYADLCRILSRFNDSEALLRRLIGITQPNHQSYNQLAVVLGNQNKTKEAIDYFKKSIELKPDFIDAYINLGSMYFRLNKLKKAEITYKQASDLDPNHILLLNNLATLYKRYKNYKKAEELYRKALKINPNSAEVLSNLGDVYGQTMNLDKAEEVLLKAYSISPKTPEINANLAILYKKQSRYEESLAYAKQAYEINTNNPALKALYADVLYINKNIIYAIKLYEEIISDTPNNLKILSMLGTCYRVIQDNKKSLDYFNRILAIVPNDENAVINISKFCTLENPVFSKDEAIELLEKTLKERPESYRIKHLIASLKEEKIDRCPKEYVEDEFDRFADSFDSVLQQSLGYKIPDTLYDTIKPHLQENLNILDLGCGTGLSGIPFKDSSAHLIGIDLSKNMLKRAENKKIYDELIHGDLTEEIDKIDKKFDLVISTDTLIYVGKLETIFNKVYNKLNKNGLFAFSTEENNSKEQYVITPSGRFKHSDDYIKEIALQNNFETITSEETIVRSEGSEQVKGFIYILKK